MTVTRTSIEWTDTTWNPVTGCSRVSEGCDHCYAETIATRFAGQKAFPNGFALTLRPARLAEPFGWRGPRRVFVNSMSDLFHDQVPDEYLAKVFAVMAATPQHTYQILTKRPARARSWITRQATAVNWDDAGLRWPLPNVWLGVSVENQRWADIRIPVLLQTPAAVRFVSAEPLLGPVDLRRAVIPMGAERGRGLTASYVHLDGPGGGCCRRFHGIDWVIAGGESGPAARPMHPDWARGLRDQCAAGGTSFLFKQWGQFAPYPDGQDTDADTRGPLTLVDPDGHRHDPAPGTHAPAGSVLMARYGKKRAGRLLDGRTHDQFPDTPTQDMRDRARPSAA